MRKGFTLIELLVVIAIIAILAAILFPVFATAKAKAKSTKCLAHMKEIAQGILMYCDDYDECTGRWEHGARGNCYTYISQIMPYMKNCEIFSCPSSDRKYRTDTRGAWSTMVYGSYGVNRSWIGTTTVGATGSRSLYDYRALATIQYPSECILFGETDSGGNNGGTNFYRNWAGIVNDTYLHNNGANVAFYDSHAKWMTEPMLIKEPPNSPMWTGGA
jgi:prepilin-type N-terminal cleavage/methylation domain-containing protein/prepilin-type processing-associated H-X9-DG protein